MLLHKQTQEKYDASYLYTRMHEEETICSEYKPLHQSIGFVAVFCFCHTKLIVLFFTLHSHNACKNRPWKSSQVSFVDSTMKTFFIPSQVSKARTYT
uniref:Uncharacterized protein n=1 Tax=Rhizophora mucronata TaxID=61149 RepID=A0A2P2IJQ2_RHIMU